MISGIFPNRMSPKLLNDINITKRSSKFNEETGSCFILFFFTTTQCLVTPLTHYHRTDDKQQIAAFVIKCQILIYMHNCKRTIFLKTNQQNATYRIDHKCLLFLYYLPEQFCQDHENRKQLCSGFIGRKKRRAKDLKLNKSVSNWLNQGSFKLV